MEERYQHIVNGQSVLEKDLNLLGQSALIDDRIFADLFRMTPYNGSIASKGVMPYVHKTSGSNALVAPFGASGSVVVRPFRAFVGSRTAEGTNTKDNWRDIRSSVFVGPTTRDLLKGLTANASGNPRWDLVYAQVNVDANGTTEDRKVKDPITKVIASSTIVLSKITSVEIGVQAGTPAASPAWPNAPADGASSYIIPLAYVRVPDAFTTTSTVLPTDIAIVAPVLSLSRSTGGGSLAVPNQAVSAAQQQAWGSSGTRPDTFLPPTIGGVESLVFAINLRTGQESHANGDVLDDRDWSKRLTRFNAFVGTGGADNPFAWTQSAPSGEPYPSVSFEGTNTFVPQATTNGHISGMGNTFSEAGGTTPSVATITNGATNAVDIYCDLADGGKLKVGYSGSPNVRTVFWIDFTGPFGNAF